MSTFTATKEIHGVVQMCTVIKSRLYAAHGNCPSFLGNGRSGEKSGKDFDRRRYGNLRAQNERKVPLSSRVVPHKRALGARIAAGFSDVVSELPGKWVDHRLQEHIERKRSPRSYSYRIGRDSPFELSRAPIAIVNRTSSMCADHPIVYGGV